MSRDNNWDLIRLWNYYRIQGRQLEGDLFCPVCLLVSAKCTCDYEPIKKDDAADMLNWWTDVIEMELKSSDHILLEKKIPLLVFSSTVAHPKIITVERPVGLFYGRTFYVDGNEVENQVTSNLPRYGWFSGKRFHAFATFDNGFIVPTDDTTSESGRHRLLVPGSKIPVYQWGVKWL